MPQKKKSKKQKRPKKTVRIVNAKVDTIVARQPKRGRQRNSSYDPFVACVFGPVDIPGYGFGVPDGSVLKSIVVDHRFKITIFPEADGTMQWALVPSPIGGVAIQRGVASFQTSNTDGNDNLIGVDTIAFTGSTFAIPGTSENTPNTFSPGIFYPVVPFSEWLANSGNWFTGAPNGSSFHVDRFRIMANTGRFQYIGDTFHNSGVAVTARVTMTPGDPHDIIPNQNVVTTTHRGINTIRAIDQLPPVDFDTTANLPGAKIFPVRCGADIINPPASFEYQPWRSCSCPGLVDSSVIMGNIGFANPPSTTNTLLFDSIFGEAIAINGSLAPNVAGNPGIGNADVTFVGIQGMQQGQGIIVEIRTCVEYVVAFNSPLVHVSKTSPKPKPAAIQAVQRIARNLPSSKPPTEEGWLAMVTGAAKGFLNSGIGNLALELGGLALSTIPGVGGLAARGLGYAARKAIAF